MPPSKSTKKFEKNKLKDVLKQRKEHAKVKQKQQMSAKRKERRARDEAPAEDVNGQPAKKTKSKSKVTRATTPHRAKAGMRTYSGKMLPQPFVDADR